MLKKTTDGNSTEMTYPCIESLGQDILACCDLTDFKMHFMWRSVVPKDMHFPVCHYLNTTGCLKKNAMEIQQAVVHHKRGQTIQFLHRTKKQLFSFSMILFLNRNDEK
jgi:hypothetical protein